MNIKSTVKRFFPFLITLALIPEYFYDYIRFLRHSGVLRATKNEGTLLGRIIGEEHVVEKGLTMPEARLGFGRDNLVSLIDNCIEYYKRFGGDNLQFVKGVAVALEYEKFHEEREYVLDADLVAKIRSLADLTKVSLGDRQIATTRDEYFRYQDAMFSEFSESRKSVRNYSSKNVPIEVICQAVDLAKNAPSSCNRQGWRVHVFTKPEQIKAILEVQGGNRGFGHLANKLIVVTEDLSISHGVYEKHQVYVDGGMFAMNLLYALHQREIGACPLNCNFSIGKDRKLRDMCQIPAPESFIVMISCGYVPDHYQIASSKRYSVETILTVK